MKGKVFNSGGLAQRSGCSGVYRYGFGGHENDPEPKGDGNFVDFGNYGLDVRIGRRWQMDPLWNNDPYLSPYNVFGNNPISNIDPDGKFFWGLFGRSSAERKLDRAHEFASKVDGTVKLTSSGAPYVVYTTSGNGGETQIRYKNSGFGDFSSWKNFRSMMKEMEYGMQGHASDTSEEYMGE